MSKAMQLVGIILLSVFTLVIINLMSDVRSTSELDYYLLQELAESSMYDAVDYSYYRDTGLLKVDRDMFLESFNRRFAASVTNNRDYNIKIIDFNETPPKVTIEAKANSIATVKGEAAVITTQVSGILETIYDDLVMSRGQYKDTFVDTNAPTVVVNTYDGSSDGTKDYLSKLKEWLTINKGDSIYNDNRKITMTDDYALDKYCIGTLSKSYIQLNESKLENLKCFLDISGKKEVDVIRNITSSGDKNEWIIVYDRAGNKAWAPLGNSRPYISHYQYNKGDVAGSLTFTMKDDTRITHYAITIDNPSPDSANWISAGENKKEGGYSVVNVTINDFYDRYVQMGEHTYYIFAKDNTGLISEPESFKTSKSDPGKAPEIESFEYKDGKLNVVFTDVDGDLDSYAITTQEYENPLYVPTNAWQSISGNRAEAAYETENKLFYIWVKDKMGNWSYTITKTRWEFAYAGEPQKFEVKATGTYKLEVWGAQGGESFNYDDKEGAEGGKGGYSSGYVKLNAGDVLYVVVGGQPKKASFDNRIIYKDYGVDSDDEDNIVYQIPGGYNGGGLTTAKNDSPHGGSGGGATHIATKTGKLSSLKNSTESVLIVAGGGGGGYIYEDDDEEEFYYKGGIGGGETGGSAKGSTNVYLGTAGTHDAGGSTAYGGNEVEVYHGSFGQGGYVIDTYNSWHHAKDYAAGGGGWYGGGGSLYGGGFGGSGYIKGVTDGYTESGVQSGHGKAVITLVPNVKTNQ